MQLFVIIGLVTRPAPSVDEEDEFVPVPLVYALLPNKTQESYATVFRDIKEKVTQLVVPNVTPNTITGDFELAVSNAAEEIFPTANVRYCFFYMGQSLYRQVQSEGLQAQYSNPDDRSLREATHMTLALAFVPTDDIEEVFNKLHDDVPDSFVPIIQYFEENYVIGRRARGRRQTVPPRFLPSKWNAYEATLQNQQRTNISEGWHNRFAQVNSNHHPSLYAAFVEICNEQADTETILTQVDLGQAVRRAPKKKWLVVQQRIRTIVADYGRYKEEADQLTYLRNLRYNFVLWSVKRMVVSSKNCRKLQH